MLKSKTVIGGIIAMLPLATDVLNQIAAFPAIPAAVAAKVAAVGGALAIVGRFMAKLPVSFK